jgi:hypothetical protein
MNETMTNLSFFGCRFCMHKPCDRLRYGRVYPGKFIFVHRRYCGAQAGDCPFIPSSFEEVEQLAINVSLIETIEITTDVIMQLSIGEELSHSQNDYVFQYNDINGRWRFLKSLWDYDIITAIRVPPAFFLDKKIARWLLAFETLAYTMKQDFKQKEEEKAVTDNLDVQQPPPVSLSFSNPRWEHEDKEQKEKSPDKAVVGDTVVLMADVRGLAEGASVSFSIFDASSEPVMRMESVGGKNEGGVGKAKWKVDIGMATNVTVLEFEASAKSATSGRVKIKLGEEMGGATISFYDKNHNILKGCKVVVKAQSDELYNGVLQDGILEITGIPSMDLKVEFEYDGKKAVSPVCWTQGNPPYILQQVTFPEQN